MTKLIAELGQNHNGDPTLFKELTWAALDSGADIVKIQSFFADDLSDEWKVKEYDRMKGLELNWDQHKWLVEQCAIQGKEAMTSVYTTKYMGKLKECGFKKIKIGSAQCTNRALIEAYVTNGFQVIVSTGGGTDVVSLPTSLLTAGYLHCVSQYPSKPWEANLNRMLAIGDWTKKPYGLSDHTDPFDKDWDLPAKLAMVMGASYLEKHFILPGHNAKDIPVSITPQQLSELSRVARIFRKNTMLDSPVSDEEVALIERYKGRWKADLS